MSNQDPGAGFPDRGSAVFAVTTVTLCLATVFVAARMVTRVFIVRRVRACDYTIVLAWLIAVFLSASVNVGAKHGLGRHERDIELQDTAALDMSEYVFSVLYNPALMATKTSILLLYFRLSKHTHITLRRASWAVLVIVNVAGTVLTFMNIFQCQPIYSAWDNTTVPEKCIPLLTEFICAAPVNIVTDLAILALPIPVLTSMRLPRRQKTILVATFGLGIFVTVIDVVRIYYLQCAIIPQKDAAPPTATFSHGNDFPWNASLAFMWSAVEVNVGIICACIPTLKPLAVRILPAMLVDGRGSKRSSTLVDSSRDTNKSTPTPLLSPPGIPPSSTETNPPQEGDEVSLREFLCITAPVPPPPLSHPPAHPSDTIPDPTQGTDPTKVPPLRKKPSLNMDFFNLPKKPKSLLTLAPKDSLLYSILVSVTLFFLWGFSYGLLNSLNKAAASITDMSTAKTLGLTSAYFGGGYFAGPAAVIFVLKYRERRRKQGRGAAVAPGGGGGGMGGDTAGESPGWFKTTFMVGLLVYGTGTIMFWPGAVLGAYGGFVASSFVVGFGLAVLETAANPFLVLCGPPAYADARLLLAQGVQAVGSVLSSVLSDRVFFVSLDGEKGLTALVDVQWTYLAITLLSALLALFFYYVPLPEVSDAELAGAAARLPVNPKQRSVGGIPLRTWALALAVFAQWCYVSAQETTSLFFQQLLTCFASELVTDLSPTTTLTTTSTSTFTRTTHTHHPAGLALSLPTYLLIFHALFASSRFLAGTLCLLRARHPPSLFRKLLPTPPTLLALTILLSTLTILTTILLPPRATNPNHAAIPLLLFTFFQAPIWPLNFSLGLRGQGERTRLAAACITMAGSGAGIWPFVAYGIIQASGGRVRLGMVVVVVLIAVAGVYPLFLAVVKGGRGLVSPPGTGENNGEGEGEGRRGHEDVEERLGRMGGGGGGGKGRGGLLGQLRDVGSGSTEKGQQDQGPGPAREAPWENEALDTSILQD